MFVQKSFRPEGVSPTHSTSAGSPSGSGGTLYLVGTPIGNLEDMTYRAIRTLKEVDLIAAEDTRQTRKLLTHFEIATRIVSYHEHNKHASGTELVRLLTEGSNIALVSDAGLPAISDPGYDLVRLCIEQRISVVPIPGANAALSALIASGLPTDRFTFIGFLPREKKDITNVLEGCRRLPGTLLFYESPYRVVKTLEILLDQLGNRNIAMARELTKRYEEFARGTVEECLDWLKQHPPQGEYVLLVEGSDGTNQAVEDGVEWWAALSLEEHVKQYETKLGNKKEAIKLAAQDRKLPKREVYNQIMREQEE